MTSHSQAAVIVTFDQVGTNVVATWSGILNAGTWVGDATYGIAFMAADPIDFAGMGPGAYEHWTGTFVNSVGFAGTVSAFTGDVGLYGNGLFGRGLDNNVSPGSIIDFNALNVSQTFDGQTLAQIGATSFNNTLRWTSSTGDTISFTTVPEPSSTLLLGVGALALAVRRRR